MIKFTVSRIDWDGRDFGERMLRAGNEGYSSVYYNQDYDEYVLLSTASEKEIKDFSEAELETIWQELESIESKEITEFTLYSGKKVLLYWEIDRFSK